MNREDNRFILNQSSCVVLTNFLNGFVLDDKIDKKLLLTYLRSKDTSNLLKIIRKTYSSGLGKIEPDDLKNLPMPNLSSRKNKDLISYFQ